MSKKTNALAGKSQDPWEIGYWEGYHSYSKELRKEKSEVTFSPGSPEYDYYQAGYWAGQRDRYTERGESAVPKGKMIEEDIGDVNDHSIASMLAKLAKVINSCKTAEQLSAAKRMASSVEKIIFKRINKKESFGQSLKHTTGILNAIDRDLKTKSREIANAVSESKVGKGVTVILESVRFRASDPDVAKILRRFPHEVENFAAGGELDDQLYDALYDHYMDAGEMPYGVAKGRTGDPYNWISDKLDQQIGTTRPVEFATVDEATGDNSMCCTYCGKDVPPGEEPSMFNCCGEVGHVRPVEDYELDSMDVGDHWEDDYNFETNDIESLEPTVAPDEDVITEVADADREKIIDMLTDIGLEEGFDFFFEGDDLVVIGRSTAHVVINTVGGYIQSVDGQEVRIGAQPRQRPVADKKDVEQLATVSDEVEETIEDPTLTATVEEPFSELDDIRWLSGLGPKKEAAIPEVELDEADDDTEYANAPDPKITMNTDEILAKGNDLNKVKQQWPGVANTVANPMAEARSLLKTYDALLKGIKK